MSNRDLVIACAAFIVIAKLSKPVIPVRRKKKRRLRTTTSLYKNKWLRPSKSPHSLAYGSRIQNDPLREESSRNFPWMSSEDFQYLLNSIRASIEKKDTTFRQAIPVEERLAVTLNYLATGNSFTYLKNQFLISKQMISQIVPDVCQAIIDTLHHYVDLPSTQEEWMQVSQQFEETWNFPHCLGALEAKHVLLQSPIQRGSYNLTLMALADADYNFLLMSIDTQRRLSDDFEIEHYQIHEKLENLHLNLPISSALPGRTKEIPYVFLGNSAVSLRDNLMKPYAGTHEKESPQQIYNCRYARVRQVVENAFGIASSVFQVLKKPMHLKPEKGQVVIMTVVCLHNFLRRSKSSRILYTPQSSLDHEVNGELIHGQWRSDTESTMTCSALENVPGDATASAAGIRDEFAEYFATTDSNILAILPNL